MKRLGSGGSRAPSALSARSKESGTPGTGTPRPSLVSRNPSTTTITQSRVAQPQTVASGVPPSPRQPVRSSFRSSLGKKTEVAAAAPSKLDTGQAKEAKLPAAASVLSPADSSPASPDSEESSSSEDAPAGPPGVRRSQIFRRGPPRLKAPQPTLSSVDDESRGDEDDDDEDSGTFLPFANAAKAEAAHTPRVAPQPTRNSKGKEPQDPGVPLRDDAAQPTLKGPGMTRQPHTRQASMPITTTSDIKGKAPLRDKGDNESSVSSASSGLPQNDGATARIRSSSAGAKRALGPLSPRHRAELARLSPRKQGTGSNGGQGSEGTPSMGSSFSDLDGEFEDT